MMLSIFRPLLALLLTGTFAFAQSEPVLFTAAAFTKAQKNSSIPTDAGIFIRLPDKGWTPYGPKIQQIASASVDPSDSRRIFLACGNGIVRSTDGGQSWRMVTDWRVSDVTAIVIDPSNGNNIYAASGWGLLRSQDGGETWENINTGIDERFSKTIKLDPRNPRRLLAGTGEGLFESTNRGHKWKRIKDVPAGHVLRLRHGNAKSGVWLAVTEGHGAWLSHDAGKTWQQTAQAAGDANLYACAVDPHNAQNLAVGGWTVGVLTSIDGGKTWQSRREGLPSPNVLTLTYDSNDPGKLWAASFEEGTVWSQDAGATWQDGGLYGALTNDLGFLTLAGDTR
jgi:hypothetical protein